MATFLTATFSVAIEGSEYIFTPSKERQVLMGKTMSRGRILYFNHDSPLPSGGMRTIYAHVATLNRNGFPAFVVHGREGFRPSWFSETAPTIYCEHKLDLTPDDVLVVPEDLPILERLKTVSVRKIVFCQNHFAAFAAQPAGQTWRSLGVSHVVASSEVIAAFVQKHLTWERVPVVHYAIDPLIFKPGAKKRQISYMPRKRAGEANFIRHLLGAIDGVSWVAMDGMPIDKVAEILAESAIFLSLSHLEGFGLPPVEAMASGCAVVGFHGYGGMEYANDENGFWCEEGNPIACAERLRDVMNMLIRGDEKIAKVVEAGRRTAAAYSHERQENELVDFMRGVLT